MNLPDAALPRFAFRVPLPAGKPHLILFAGADILKLRSSHIGRGQNSTSWRIDPLPSSALMTCRRLTFWLSSLHSSPALRCRCPPATLCPQPIQDLFRRQLASRPRNRRCNNTPEITRSAGTPSSRQALLPSGSALCPRSSRAHAPGRVRECSPYLTGTAVPLTEEAVISQIDALL